LLQGDAQQLLVDEVTFDLKSQPLPFIEKELLFVKFFSTVEQATTLSAERKILVAAVSQSDNGCTLSLASIAW
jgi:hypothetical protein